MVRLLSQREIVSNDSLFSVWIALLKFADHSNLFAHNVPFWACHSALVKQMGSLSSSYVVDNSATPSLLGKAKAFEFLGGFGLSFYFEMKRGEWIWRKKI